MFLSGTQLCVEPTAAGIHQTGSEDHVVTIPSSDEDEGSERDENEEIEDLEKRAFDDDEGIISDKE
jgi:hypothetical protein